MSRAPAESTLQHALGMRDPRYRPAGSRPHTSTAVGPKVHHKLGFENSEVRNAPCNSPGYADATWMRARADARVCVCVCVHVCVFADDAGDQ